MLSIQKPLLPFQRNILKTVFPGWQTAEWGLQRRKISAFLELVRAKANCPFSAQVNSRNFVPTAAGLASSASGLAALAGACNAAPDLQLSQTELSRLARRGSGSACRSIFGGFVEWHTGDDDTSYATPIASEGWGKRAKYAFHFGSTTKKKMFPVVTGCVGL